MKSRINLVEIFRDRGFKKGAEVGVADGRFSEKMLQMIPGLELWCVDPWDISHGNRRGGSKDNQLNNYELATQRLNKYQPHYMRMMSSQAAPLIKDEFLDFVFLDGNHDYKFVLEDIELWSQKVRFGGIVSGHDYYQFKNSGVIEAVTTYCKTHGIDPYIGGDPTRKTINDDHKGFFWWVKQ